MRCLSLVVAACVFVAAHAHYGIFVFDSEGNNESYCVPFEANATDLVGWYAYGDPVANSFNAFKEPIDFHPDLANRATVLAVSTVNGHDPLGDQVFGFVFGSTDNSSSAGTATLRCSAPEWIGLREDPIRLLDDEGDVAIFDHMSGDAYFEFSWPAGETDGFLVYDVDFHMKCHLGDATGLTETIGLFDDVAEADPDASPFVSSQYMFEDGIRVEIHKSCLGSEPEALDTTTATAVDFTRIAGTNGPGTASGHFWYNATTGYLTWQFELSAFDSQVTSIELRNGDNVMESLGSSDTYYFELSGMVMLESAVGEAYANGDLTVFIVSQDIGDELVGSTSTTTDGEVEEDSASRSGIFAPMVVLVVAIAATML